MKLEFTADYPKYLVNRFSKVTRTLTAIGNIATNSSTELLDYYSWYIITSLENLPPDERRQIKKFLNAHNKIEPLEFIE